MNQLLGVKLDFSSRTVNLLLAFMMMANFQLDFENEIKINHDQHTPRGE